MAGKVPPTVGKTAVKIGVTQCRWSDVHGQHGSSRNAQRHHRFNARWVAQTTASPKRLEHGQPGRSGSGANNRPGSSRRIRNAAAQNHAVRNPVSSITQTRYPMILAAIAKLALVCAGSNGSHRRLQVRLRRAVTRTRVLDGSGWLEES